MLEERFFLVGKGLELTRVCCLMVLELGNMLGATALFTNGSNPEDLCDPFFSLIKDFLMFKVTANGVSVNV